MVAKSLNEKYLTFTSFRAGIAAGQKETPPQKKPQLFLLYYGFLLVLTSF